MIPETRSAPRSTSTRTESGQVPATRRGDLGETMPPVLDDLLAFTAVLATLVLLPMAAMVVLPPVASLPLGVLAVAALLATPVLAPLLIVGLLALIVE